MKRFLAVLSARNKEFIRDRSSLVWNLLFPILVIGGFAFAFSGSGQEQYKIGIIGDESHFASTPLAQTRYINFVYFSDLESARVKVERHQIDLLLNLQLNQYWINSTSPKGYLAEKILLGTSTSNTYQKQTVTGREIRYVDWLIPGIMAMNMMFSALFGVGYVIVRYRKNGMLRRLKATPLTAFEYLSAQVISRLWLILFITTIVYSGLNLLLDFAMFGSYFSLLAVFTVGTICMISLGLLMASRIRSEELAGGLLNMASWPMMFLSGVWFSLEGSPEILRAIAYALPLTHVTDAARAIMIDGASFIAISDHILILAIMSLLFLALGSRLFRWE